MSNPRPIRVCVAGHEALDAGAFCGVCGARVRTEFELDCGHTVVEPERYCPVCGKRQPHQDDETPGRNRGNTHALGWVVAIAIVVAGAVALLVLRPVTDSSDRAGSVAPTADDLTTSVPPNSDSNTATVPTTGLPTVPPPTFREPSQEFWSQREWVAVLASVPMQEGFAAGERALNEIRRDRPGALLLNSDYYPSLRSGYWAVYESGFSSRDDVEAHCRRIERSIPDQCNPRILSQDPADR